MWFRKQFPPKGELVLKEAWVVKHGKYCGRPVIVRLNRGVESALGHPAYSHQVGVALPLRHPDDRGFPNPTENEALGQIEDDLVAALCNENRCIYAAAISTGGMREFVFYTSDAEATHRDLERLRALITSHDVQHVIQEDPKWNVYREFA